MRKIRDVLRLDSLGSESAPDCPGCPCARFVRCSDSIRCGLYAKVGGPPTRISFQLTTQHLDTESVIFKVAEPVGLAAECFHFVVEALSDAVVAGEAPHRGDLFLPAIVRFPQLDHLR